MIAGVSITFLVLIVACFFFVTNCRPESTHRDTEKFVETREADKDANWLWGSRESREPRE